MIPRVAVRCPKCGYSDEDLRSLDQNSKMWSMLTEIASQIEWPVNGKLEHLTAWEWKDIFTASLKQNSRIAQGLDGGFVFIGAHTSRMSKGLMAELIDLIAAFGAERGIEFREAA